MAVDCIPAYTFTAKMEETAAREAASAGLQSVDKLIRLLSASKNFPAEPTNAVDCRAVVDVAVNKFKKFISILDRCRTGHARFRRGPIHNNRDEVKPDPETASSPPRALPAEDDTPHAKTQYPTPVQRLPPLPQQQQQLVRNGSSEKKETATTINFGSPATSFRSGLTGDTDSLQQSGFQITNLSSSGRPPPCTSSLKRKCTSMGGGSSGSRCHCPKKRKSRVKRVERVAAISTKMADIPPDDYSWRKYGQKPIKGSPHPRGYYKCSSVRGCPARKHVERALDDPSMLIVTYEAEHNHSHPSTQSPALILESY